ncbi:MAG: flavodoxin family protein [Promethearchaeota archaeon]
MPEVLLIYYTRTGNTERMANIIADAIMDENIDIKCKKVENTNLKELLDVEGVVIGSPTYFGCMAAEIKKFIDDSIIYHGRLDGKVGAAFSSSAIMGHETTVISILEALLVHGMIIQGDPKGQHFGATTVGKPDKNEFKWCHRFGQRFAKLVKLIVS